MNALVIDLAELPEEGKQYSGALDAEIFSLPQEDAKPVSPLEFDLFAQRFETELLLLGNVSATFEFTCVRDLQTFKKTISLPSAAISLEIGPESAMDVTEAVREELLINFPEYPRCEDADTPQACEIDERYLAVDKPGSDDVESPPAGDGDSRWDALDQLGDPPKES